VRIKSIRRFQGLQHLRVDDEPAAIDIDLFQIVRILSVERLGDLLVGENNNTDLILLCQIECDRHQIESILAVAYRDYAAREFAGRATRGL
jgi:hypothetical protein